MLAGTVSYNWDHSYIFIIATNNASLRSFASHWQNNGSDCGVFSCAFAEALSRNANFNFSQVFAAFWRHIWTMKTFPSLLMRGGPALMFLLNVPCIATILTHQENMPYFRRRIAVEIITKKLLSWSSNWAWSDRLTVPISYLRSWFRPYCIVCLLSKYNRAWSKPQGLLPKPVHNNAM